MAKKQTQEQPGGESTSGSETETSFPRPAQGITPQFMATGNPKLDFITKFKRPRIDPASLVVDGADPFLALPIDADMSKVRVRQVAADHASDLLSCDPGSGGTSIYRLATDAEVEAYQAELATRVAKK